MNRHILTIAFFSLGLTNLQAEEMKKNIDREGREKSTVEIASTILEITQNNFQSEIAKSPKPVIIDVYSHSCPPCRMMDPIIEELSREYENKIRFVKINCESEIELSRKYGITQLPTFLFIKPGQETPVIQISGFTPKKNFQAKINEFLEKEINH